MVLLGPNQLALAAEARTATSPDASYVTAWRRTLLVSLPFGIAAFVVGWLLDGPSGQSTPFDAVVYPSMAAALASLWVLLALHQRFLSITVLTIVAGTSVFLVSKLVYLLFFGLDPGQVHAELTESFFWIPVIYLLSFILPGEDAGRRIAAVFTLAVLGVSVVYAAAPGGLAPASLSVVYALVQMNLANTVLLGLTRAFIGFKEAYTATQTRMESAERFAAVDVLTGLSNRFALQRTLDDTLRRARARGELVALLFIDLDGFKTFNVASSLPPAFARTRARQVRLSRSSTLLSKVTGAP